MMPRTPSLSSSIRSVFGDSKQKVRDEETGIEGIDLQEVSVEETIEPPDSYQCNDKCRHITNKEELILSDGGITIKIVVGTPPDRKTFIVHKCLLRQHSEYFAIALRDGNEDRFIEADRGVFEWPEDEPEQVHRWVRWLYSCSSCRQGDPYNSAHVCKEGGELAEDPNSWCAPDVEPEQAFLLGDRILSAEYCRFALAAFVQHAHLADPYRIVWTHESLPERSSMRRFVHAWLGWMKFKLDKRLEMSADEEAAAAAYSKGFVYIDGWKTSDPRKYLMEHWSEPCSLENKFCDHKRAHWFWRRTASGTPGKEPSTSVLRVSSARKMICQGSLGVWYGCCMAMLVLSAYIIARDREGLIAQSSKVLGVVTATFALLGMCFCGDLVPLVSMPTVMISFAAAIFSSQQAGRCFQIATSGTSICKIQTGFASVEMVYTLVLSGIVFAWDRYDGGYFSS